MSTTLQQYNFHVILALPTLLFISLIFRRKTSFDNYHTLSPLDKQQKYGNKMQNYCEFILVYDRDKRWTSEQKKNKKEAINTLNGMQKQAQMLESNEKTNASTHCAQMKNKLNSRKIRRRTRLRKRKREKKIKEEDNVCAYYVIAKSYLHINEIKNEKRHTIKQNKQMYVENTRSFSLCASHSMWS